MNVNRWIEFADGGLRLQTGPIATLELNAPERRNAMSMAMWAGIRDIVRAVEADATVRALLLRGAGGKAFCGGAHIGEFDKVYATEESTRAYNEIVRAAQADLRALARPTIAVIEGACVGGGCGIALSCDLRFASDDARFAITPAKLGLAYSYADTAQLVEKVGPARAKDILFSGRLIGAPEALRIGLIDRLAPAGELDALSRAYAETLSALSQTSIRTAKRMINRLADFAAKPAPDMDALFSEAFAGPDFREGYRAFLEKRAPRFR